MPHWSLSEWQSSGAGTGTALLHPGRETGWCEGTLITHADGWVECSEPACDDLHAARHAWALTCASLWSACVCRPEEAAPAQALRA